MRLIWSFACLHRFAAGHVASRCSISLLSPAASRFSALESACFLAGLSGRTESRSSFDLSFVDKDEPALPDLNQLEASARVSDPESSRTPWLPLAAISGAPVAIWSLVLKSA